VLSLFLMFFMFQSQNFYEHYEKGVELIRDGRYSEAIIELEKATALKPESAARAKTYGVQLVEYFPYHFLTEAYLRQGDLDRAAEYLSRARQFGEDADETVRFQLWLYENALASRRDDEETPEFDLTGVMEHLSKGRYAKANEHVSDLLTENPDNESLLALSQILKSQLADREKLRLIQDELDHNLNQFLEQARKYASQDDPFEAYFFYNKVITLESDHAEAQAFLRQYEEVVTQQGREEVENLEQRLVEMEQAYGELSESISTQQSEREVLLQRNQRLSTQLNLFRRQKPSVMPVVSVDWVIERVSGLTYNIKARVESNVQLQKAVLVINGSKVNTWEIRGKEIFQIPSLVNHTFAKNKNTLEIRVTDRLDNIYEKIYTHNIPQPSRKLERLFFRSLFAVGSISLLLLFFVKQRRQRQAFRERFNPYIAGAPVLTERMFYGRKPMLKQILNTLHNNSLMIYGERRIGKTSFLHRLNTVLPHVDDPDYAFFPVLIDLQGVSEEDFFSTIDREILATLQPQDLDLDPTSTKPMDGRTFTERIRQILRYLKKQTEKEPKLVLLLDEVDVMNRFSEKTNQQLRSVFMKGFARHLVAVMAGIHISKRWKSEGSPWYNFFEQIELKPFTRSQAEALITQPVRGVYVYEPQAVSRIMELAAVKPYLIQKICVNLITHILNENRRKIRLEDVEYVYGEIKDELTGATS